MLNHFHTFKVKYFKIFIAVTIINSIIGFFLADIKIFLIRQFITCFVLTLLTVFSNEIDESKAEIREVQLKLEQTHEIFSYDSIIFLASPVPLFLVFFQEYLPYRAAILVFSALFSTLLVVYCFFRWYCLFQLVKKKQISFSKANRINGVLRRSVSTYIQGGLRVAPELLKLGGVAAQATNMTLAGCGIYKVVYGMDARPPVFNAFSYAVTGLTAERESVYSLGYGFIESVKKVDPDVKVKITEGAFNRISSDKFYGYLKDKYVKDPFIRQVIDKSPVLKLFATSGKME